MIDERARLRIARLGSRSRECGDPRDERQDSDADRECARSPGRVLDDPLGERAGGVAPGLRQVPEQRRDPDRDSDPSAANPTQSQPAHVERQRRDRSDCQQSQSRPSTSNEKRIDSCVRVSVAAAHASTARPARLHVGSTYTRAMSHSATSRAGRRGAPRRGSASTRARARPPRLRRPPARTRVATTIRASAYAGKTVAVIASTSRSFAAAYPLAAEPTHQTGARK